MSERERCGGRGVVVVWERGKSMAELHGQGKGCWTPWLPWLQQRSRLQGRRRCAGAGGAAVLRVAG
jgi:hypothetical protein